VASLYLGRFEGDKLLYAGKAQTGFRTDDLYLLRERLDPYITSSSPLSVPVKKPKATWVRPELHAEIEYSAFTADGLLRAPVYKGLRDDLAPVQMAADMDSRRGRRQSASDKARVMPHRAINRAPGKRSVVPKENILQLLPNAVAPSPEALAEYWRRVHHVALSYLARRPLKLVRHVAGATFYHKGPLPKIPAAVHQLRVVKREGGEGTRVWVDDLDGLLGLVAMDVVELHPWNATVDDIELADTLVIDLDPGHGVSWSFVLDTAFTLRELLEQHGFARSWPKLTGGKGLHVMVPLAKRMTHDAAHRQSRTIAERLASLDPDRYTVSAALSARKGRLFLDYLRNGRGTTAVGAYSPRARAPGTIAVPVEWHELEQGVLRPNQYTIDAPPRTDHAFVHTSRARPEKKAQSNRTRPAAHK
jgi:bifunctional non-homologous end joining protein LigD